MPAPAAAPPLSLRSRNSTCSTAFSQTCCRPWLQLAQNSISTGRIAHRPSGRAFRPSKNSSARKAKPKFVPNDLFVRTPARQQLLADHRAQHGRQFHLSSPVRLIVSHGPRLGSFVPADKPNASPSRTRQSLRSSEPATISRAPGLSTFLVEMSEVAPFLNHATPASLVLLERSRPPGATAPSEWPLHRPWLSSSICKSTPARARSSPTHYMNFDRARGLSPTVERTCTFVR